MGAGMDGTRHLETVADRVRAILAEQAVLDISEVTAEARLADLGIDSLGLVESIFAIEETFDISVPFNANDPAQGSFDISTVASVIAGVEALITAK